MKEVWKTTKGCIGGDVATRVVELDRASGHVNLTAIVRKPDESIIKGAPGFTRHEWLEITRAVEAELALVWDVIPCCTPQNNVHGHRPPAPKMYKLVLPQPLDMDGAGSEQDAGWLKKHNIRVVDDHVLEAVERGMLELFLREQYYPGEDEQWAAESMINEIEEVAL